MMKVVLKILIFVPLLKFCSGYTSAKFEAENDVYFLLRIQNRDFNNVDVVNLAGKENLGNTAFDPSKPILFLAPGYLEDSKKPHHLLLSKTMLEQKDMNLFFVDWSKGSKTLDYSLARERVNNVSKTIGEFVNFMNSRYDVSPSNVCCVGFSLGAHICGLINSYVINGKLNKVFGLDPAGPLFNVADPTKRISPDSASYVECIYTGFPLGIRSPVCQANFFMNKGIAQPGCSNMFNVDNFSCSHCRAVQFFIEALKVPKSFYGKFCSSYENALKGNCVDEPGAFMVDPENKANNLSGIFHVTTNANEPFGRGKE